ncbi:MAG: DUF3592 domain-containing protein [Rickettsiales bacterium]
MIKLLLVVIFIFLVFVVAGWQKRGIKDFADRAEVVTAIVIEKYEKTRKADHPSRVERIINYSYMVEGKEYTGEDTVEFSDLWQQVKKGQEIEVYFLRENPAKSHPVILVRRRAGKGDY